MMHPDCVPCQHHRRLSAAEAAHLRAKHEHDRALQRWREDPRDRDAVDALVLAAEQLRRNARNDYLDRFSIAADRLCLRIERETDTAQDEE